MHVQYQTKRLDHLGIVAGICEEIGLAAYLDARDEGWHDRVSVGTATVAMILNGLGFSNRRLYLVSQFFATKPVEHLLGPGIRAEDLNDDCLGRTLDWLYAHDPTVLFAGIARQARQQFGITARQVHVDTTSFSVHGEYAGEPDAQAIAVTYVYSRDHRADLKQWMAALATTYEGDVPLFYRALDGNASDKQSLIQAVEALAGQFADADEEAPILVADSGMYSIANMARLNAARIAWVCRVPETLREAKAALEVPETAWQHEGSLHWAPTAGRAGERWLVVRTDEGLARARATLERQAAKDQQTWTDRFWHLSNQEFNGEADAQQALTTACKRCPAWLTVQTSVVAHPVYAQSGRPAKNAVPARLVWLIQATIQTNQDRLEQEARRKAAFIIATNVLDATAFPDREVIATYKAQPSVERGFTFLKDPLFLASSVFLKNPERIVALGMVMVLCLLVFRLAEQQLRRQLVATGQTVPNQLNKPYQQPTMRWMFQCFEGIDVLHIPLADSVQSAILNVLPLHEQVVTLLGPAVMKFYKMP